MNNINFYIKIFLNILIISIIIYLVVKLFIFLLPFIFILIGVYYIYKIYIRVKNNNRKEEKGIIDAEIIEERFDK